MKRLGIILALISLTLSAYAQNEKLALKEGKIYLDNTPYTGEHKVYDNQSLASVFTIKDGIKEGKVTHYYNDTLVKEVGDYNSGQKNGKWEKWDEKGNKIGEAYYNNGLKTGTWIVWDHNGTKRYEMSYSNGEKTGTWKIWNSQGDLTQEKKY